MPVKPKKKRAVKPKRKKSSKKKSKNSSKSVDYENSVLKDRELFLTGSVDNKATELLIKKIKALDKLNHKPIKLYINSGGGSVHAGFALINVMKEVKSKIITIINTQACSMAGLISISGDERYIAENGFWMGHDMSGGIYGDYSAKVEARGEYIKKLWVILADHIKGHSDLETKDINHLRNKELWLTAEECVDKGIVDKIARNK